jgi:RimJ/RimL family protein N-acetyltransferase
MNLLSGNDQVIADWASKKWGKPIAPWYHAVGIINSEGILCGAITFHNMNGSSAELCYYGPKTFTRRILRELAHFCIDHLKLNRLTLSVPRKNKVLVKALSKLGFKMEGVLRHFYGPYHRDDAIVFGILAQEGKVFL